MARTLLIESMKNAHKNSELVTLTKTNIKDLIGKRIQILCYGYTRGQDIADDFIVGEIISRYEFASRTIMEDGRTRAEYWDSFMKSEEIKKMKNDLVVLTSEGRNTFIYFDSVDNFAGALHMGDTDRCVYYKVVR